MYWTRPASIKGSENMYTDVKDYIAALAPTPKTGLWLGPPGTQGLVRLQFSWIAASTARIEDCLKIADLENITSWTSISKLEKLIAKQISTLNSLQVHRNFVGNHARFKAKELIHLLRRQRIAKSVSKLDWTIVEVDATISAFGAGPQHTPMSSTSTPATQLDDDVTTTLSSSHAVTVNPLAANVTPSTQSSPKIATQARASTALIADGWSPCMAKSLPASTTAVNMGKIVTLPRRLTSPPNHPLISPFLITQFAAVKNIVNLVGLSHLKVLTLRTNIDIWRRFSIRPAVLDPQYPRNRQSFRSGCGWQLPESVTPYQNFRASTHFIRCVQP